MTLRDTSSSRTVRVAEAHRLRAEGLLLREIAERMGVAIQTVDTWLHDPDGSRLRARKDSYRGICVDCGASTSGSNGPGRAHKRCKPCADHASVIWTPEAIVQVIRAWVRENGAPPTATDWNPSYAIARGHPEKAAKFREGVWPHLWTVQRKFGSWNAAILAAGFEPIARGRRAK